MATKYCDLIQSRSVVRCDAEGVEQQFMATLKLAVGEQIAANDIVEIAFLGANHVVTEIKVITDDLDDGTTMVWDVGFSKLSPGTGYAGTNTSGDAIDYAVDLGTTGVSPTSDPDFYVSGATFGRAAGFSTLTLASTATADTDGHVGPVRLIATETAATPTQTTADDSVRYVRFLFKMIRNSRVPDFTDRGGYV